MQITMRKDSKPKPNQAIRKLMREKGIRGYDAAQACGVHSATFSRWLALELPIDKQAQIIAALNSKF